MVFANFTELKRGLVKRELLGFTRNKLRSLMLRATGRRRHSQTKEEMADIIMRYTPIQTVQRIIGTTTR